jgi:hypothetical protein
MYSCGQKKVAQCFFANVSLCTISMVTIEILIYLIYSVEITYGINSVISKLMTFAENAETGQFLFLIVLILSYFTSS